MVAQSNIRVVFKAFQDFSTRLVRKIVLDATANLVEDTPVDTGWARANWVPTIGSPFRGTAGTREQAEAGRVDLSAREQGIATIATSYNIADGSVSITNNVPYIRFLNEGSRSRPPTMFVQSAIRRALTSASRLRSP